MYRSTSSGNGDYSPHLREMFQGRVAGWIGDCLALEARQAGLIAGVVLMAFDGFAMNVHLAHGMACNTEIARVFSTVLAAPSGGAAPV